MHLTFFRSTGWTDWDVAAEPAFPDRMPVLIDNDLLFEDTGVLRPSATANRWLRELPVSGPRRRPRGRPMREYCATG
jgi:hypothetical protein